MEQEIWKDVPSAIGILQVSNLGRAKRVHLEYERENLHPRVRSEKILLQNRTRSGYHTTNCMIKYKLYRFLTHRLVMEAFVGTCPNGMCVDHIDGNPLNNRLENLRYVSQRENVMNPSTKWKNPNKTTFFTGVWRGKQKNGKVKFVAVISVKNKKVFIGTFNTAMLAGIAYIKYKKDNAL